MVRPALPLDSCPQAAKRKEREYLALTFFEKDRGMVLEVAGWTKLRPQPDKPAYIRGIINRWGRDIPVIDLKILYGKGPTCMKDSACIVILEGPGPHKYYFGMVVEDWSDLVNAADGTENKTSPLLLSAERHLSVDPALGN